MNAVRPIHMKIESCTFAEFDFEKWKADQIADFESMYPGQGEQVFEIRRAESGRSSGNIMFFPDVYIQIRMQQDATLTSDYAAHHPLDPKKEIVCWTRLVLENS